MSERIDQILEVLEFTRARFLDQPSIGVSQCRKLALSVVSKRLGILPSTVSDKYRRQLWPPVKNTTEFDALVNEWLVGKSSALENVLIKHSVDRADLDRIESFFASKS